MLPGSTFAVLSRRVDDGVKFAEFDGDTGRLWDFSFDDSSWLFAPVKVFVKIDSPVESLGI